MWIAVEDPCKDGVSSSHKHLGSMQNRRQYFVESQRVKDVRGPGLLKGERGWYALDLSVSIRIRLTEASRPRHRKSWWTGASSC